MALYDRFLRNETMAVEAPDIEENEWKVYFASGFWKHRGRDKAGDEITVGKQFNWNNDLWHIPAVYACRAGLVVDYCIQIETDRIRQFVEKWEAIATEEERLSAEERELLESENPLNVDFESSLVVNGNQLRRKSGYSMSWIPKGCGPEGTRNVTEWYAIMNHYQLDQSMGWVIKRYSYPWDYKRKPVIKTLQVKLAQRPVPVMGMKVKSPKPGAEFVCTHPITGIDHIVTIQDVERQELDVQKMHQDTYQYPTHYTRMSYTLSPELPYSEFYIGDCLQSDSPRRKQGVDGNGACAIGIIGGADGPTAIFLADKSKEPQLHAACSALHFEPVGEVEWKMVFRVKRCEDIAVELI